MPVEQLDFFAKRGEELRDSGIQKADEHADPKWRRDALATVRRCAESRSLFTTDLVWEHMESETHEPRAMGAVMLRAQKLGWIQPSENWELSRRPECHRRPIRVWRSRLRQLPTRS
jgi:hypothetical protein